MAQKFFILTILLLSISVNALADRVILESKSTIYNLKNDDIKKPRTLVKLPSGTEVSIDPNTFIENKKGLLYKVNKVFDVEKLGETATNVNARIIDQGETLYIKASAYRESFKLTPESPLKGFDKVTYTDYLACYVYPRGRIAREIEAAKRKQRNRGRKKNFIGLAAAVGGVILGAATDKDDLGEVVSFAGQALMVIGAVEIENSNSVFSYDGQYYGCDKMYDQDRHRHTFHNADGNYCVTTRYSSRRWNGSHEYFETDCGHSRRYLSFERSRRTWRY